MDEKSNMNFFNKMLFNVGIYLILYILVIIVYVTIMQFFKQSITSSTLIVSTVLSVFMYGIISYRNHEKIKNVAITIIISLTIIYAGILFASKTYDLTCDGNTYHKYAIGNLKNGWNPVYESSFDSSISNSLYPDSLYPNSKMPLWVDHYPKATWTFAAAIYAFTSDIESGKAITILLAIAFIMLSTSYLTTRYIKLWQSLLVSILIGFSPIVCSQIFSYYVDGTLGITIYIMTLFLIMITDKKYNVNNIEKWIGLLISIILCINIKFTGLVFSGVFSIIFYIYWLYIAKKEDKLLKDFINKTMFFVITVVLALAFVGYSSYIKNFIDHKNPLYPLFGEGKVDIITTMQPASFENKIGIEKLAYSLFSKTDNVTYTSGKSPEFKIPFTVTDEEIKNLSLPDTRIGGYGVLFGGIFLTSIIIIIFGMTKLYKNKGIEFVICSLVIISIIVSTLVMTESWWFRYSPQLYIIPILALIILFAYFNSVVGAKKRSYIKIIFAIGICTFMCFTMFINTKHIINWRFEEIKYFEKISTEMYKVKNNIKMKVIDIAKPNYIGILFNLKDQEINFNVINIEYKDAEGIYTIYNDWIKVLGE